MLHVTENAAKQIRALTPMDTAGKGLRIFIEKGGCSGMQYGMKIDGPQTEDTVIECGEGARVFIDPQSLSFIKNSQIDYSDSLTNTGFKIINPNAKQTCGCGTSFEP